MIRLTPAPCLIIEMLDRAIILMRDREKMHPSNNLALAIAAVESVKRHFAWKRAKLKQ